MLAQSKKRNQAYHGEQEIQWLDGNIKMHAIVQSRNGGPSVECRIQRVQTVLANGKQFIRMIAECQCGYPTRDGVCDHAVHIGDTGQAFNPMHLFPYCRTTECWREQYPLDSTFAQPTEMEMLDITGCDVRGEAGLVLDDMIVPVVAMKRSKGRPAKLKRQDKYTLAQKAKPTRVELTSLGELIEVPKNKCRLCGQIGHKSTTCRGRGFVQSITNSIIGRAALKAGGNQKKRAHDEV